MLVLDLVMQLLEMVVLVIHHQLAGTAFLPQILIIHHHQVIAHSRTLMLNRKADQDSRSADQKEKDGQPTHSALMPIAQFVLFLYPSVVTASRSIDALFKILPRPSP